MAEGGHPIIPLVWIPLVRHRISEAAYLEDGVRALCVPPDEFSNIKRKGLTYHIYYTTWGINQNRERTNVYFFIKCTANFDIDSEYLHALFMRELFVHEAVFPEFEKVQRASVDGVMFAKYARLLSTSRVKDIMVFEDLSGDYFKPKDVNHSINISHAVLIMKNLARFHALSYAIRDRSPEVYAQFPTACNWTLWEQMRQAYNENVQHARNAIVQHAEDPSHIEAFDQSVFRHRSSLCEESPFNNYSVLCHGSPRYVNFMFKYADDDIEREQPIDLMFVDFQRLHFGSPVHDISHFLMTSLNHNTLTMHFFALIDIYLKSFNDYHTRFGIRGTPRLTNSILSRELKTHFRWGMLAASSILWEVMNDEEEYNIRMSELIKFCAIIHIIGHTPTSSPEPPAPDENNSSSDESDHPRNGQFPCRSPSSTPPRPQVPVYLVLPGDSAASSAESTESSAESAGFSAESAGFSAESAAISAESAAFSTESTESSVEPASFAEPAASSAEPAASPAEPPASSSEPVAYPAEPTASSAEPTASSVEPAASSAESAAYSADVSATSTDVLTSPSDLAGSSVDVPASSELAASSTDVSESSAMLAGSSADMSASSTDIPASSTDMSASCTDVPSSSTDMPASSTATFTRSRSLDQSSGSRDQPLDSREQPSDSREQSSGSRNQSSGSRGQGRNNRSQFPASRGQGRNNRSQLSTSQSNRGKRNGE